MNLLNETRYEMIGIGKTISDIKFIGSHDGVYGCTIEEFEKLANIEYNDGYGSQEIPEDLVILFNDDSYLARWEYDGSEGWKYMKSPVKPESYKPIKTLRTGNIGHYTMKSMNPDD